MKGTEIRQLALEREPKMKLQVQAFKSAETLAYYRLPRIPLNRFRMLSDLPIYEMILQIRITAGSPSSTLKCVHV